MLWNLLRRLLQRDSWRMRRMLPPKVAPSMADALDLHRAGHDAEAEGLCRELLAVQPDDADGLNLLAAILCMRGRASEGIDCLRRIAELQPRNAGAHANLADALAATGRVDDAIAQYQRALAVDPALPRCAERLARLLKALGSYDDAEACCLAALAAGGDTAALRHVLSEALFEQGRVEDAVVEVRRALALDANVPATHSDLLRMLNYSGELDPATLWREHRAWAERHARALECTALPHANEPDPARRLRVGFVSPHFRKHAMNFFFESTAEHFDYDRFEVTLYADVAQPDEFSTRLQDYGAAWRPTLQLTDAELAGLVREDSIDILVDLSGHTRGNRLLAFARRPAPVQVTWNGYPNTTGMSSIDYRITDAYCDPPGTTEELHSERLEYLAPIYMTWRPPAGAPEVVQPPGLSRSGVTFGSFNSCFKVTPALVATWARVLLAVPGSRLMVLTVNSGKAERRIRELFGGCGISGSRLEFLPRLTHERFLEAHGHADVALDSFPYHGTTTTCFSLWMGLPVVSLAGPSHLSRVGVSLLTNAGLPQCVARDAEDYVAIAARLAGDLPGLAAMRAGMRNRLRASPLTDGRAGARALQSALRRMWSAWCARHTPPHGKRF